MTTNESEIWKTDGTPVGTTLVKSLGASLTRAADVTVLNDILYFGGVNEEGGLWQTDGTACGTHQIDAMGGLMSGGISWRTGALTGFMLWFGFIAPTYLVNKLFAGHGLKVWAIEVGNHLLNFLLFGAILGAWQ